MLGSTYRCDVKETASAPVQEMGVRPFKVESAECEVKRLVIEKNHRPCRRGNEPFDVQRWGKGINELCTVVRELEATDCRSNAKERGPRLCLRDA